MVIAMIQYDVWIVSLCEYECVCVRVCRESSARDKQERLGTNNVRLLQSASYLSLPCLHWTVSLSLSLSSVLQLGSDLRNDKHVPLKVGTLAQCHTSQTHVLFKRCGSRFKARHG